MARTKKVAAPAKNAAKAETFVPEVASKMLEEGLEKATGYAKMYGEAAETGMKTMTSRVQASTEVLRTIGARNVDFFTQTIERSVEAGEALTSARDPRALMDIQTSFAKTMMAAYTKEFGAQSEIWLNVWREAAKTASKVGR